MLAFPSTPDHVPLYTPCHTAFGAGGGALINFTAPPSFSPPPIDPKMGLEGMTPHMERSNELQDKLEDIPRTSKGPDLPPTCVLAWDLSGSLYPPLRKAAAGEDFYSRPPRPIPSILSALDKVVAMFTAADISLIAVTDGCDHPFKLETAVRAQAAKDTLSRLKALWRKGSPADYNACLQLKTKATKVRPDILADVRNHLREKHNIPCLGAPYEAKWQCVALEAAGKVDGIFSIDSDCMALGANLVVHKIRGFDVPTGEVAEDGTPISRKDVRCSILRHGEVLDRIGKLMNARPLPFDTFIALGNFVGNDYIRRVKGTGGDPAGTAGKYAAKWGRLADGDRQKFLRSFNWCRHENNKRVFNKGAGKVTKYEEKFERAFNLFKYCPVFKLVEGRYEIKPLWELPVGVLASQWPSMIGFNPLSTFHRCKVSIDDAASFKESCRYGPGKLRPVPMPPHPAGSDKQAPHGSVIDFSFCPVVLQPTRHLRLWLACRAVPTPGCTSHEDYVYIVREILRLESEGVQRPIAAPPDSNDWASMDVIEPRGGSGMSWEKGNGALDFIRSVEPICKSFLDSKFGVERNGVRQRGFFRLESGCYDVESLGVAEAKLVATEENVGVVDITCTPSMKCKLYNTRFVFSEFGKFNAWASSCECPDGALFCSHMVGGLLLFYCIQTNPNWTFQELKSAMPQPIRSLQNRPIAVHYVYDVVGRETRDIKNWSKRVAKEHPGYSGEGELEEDGTLEDRMVELNSRKEAAQGLDVCAMAKGLLAEGARRAHVRGLSGPSEPKFTEAGIEEYNDSVVSKSHPMFEGEDIEQAETLELVHRLSSLDGGYIDPCIIQGFASFPQHVQSRRDALPEYRRRWSDDELRSRFRKRKR